MDARDRLAFTLANLSDAVTEAEDLLAELADAVVALRTQRAHGWEPTHGDRNKPLE